THDLDLAAIADRIVTLETARGGVHHGRTHQVSAAAQGTTHPHPYPQPDAHPHPHARLTPAREA
ncbi:hypothetical protein AB0M20_44670, partial [Actinoplanes sp. NPDC051633]|uniref:hypothetical protein n=1 Tax=Actinoplanes sp. NPDC051633 TaxID=3155670 RepID=UPI003444A271